ncbi:unnamed protein product [Thelazia callipaeda]|uniref:Clusterin-associated protein 1 n=1 Tax=Thelazia callipaeda TaxID=103827 RepID=A0A0N5CZN4_THECL|nr:unnamed protein product [Thelazia callipaeda]
MAEQLRVLRYPRLVSIENFRKPNFRLVAELLEWIVRKYDDQTSLSLLLETEQDRILFIKSATFHIFQKARIKLNPRKLYMADGYAAQELAVVIKNLYEITYRSTDVESKAVTTTLKNALLSKLNERTITKVQEGLEYAEELHKCRQLALEIPNSGATLYDLLAKESVVKVERNKALSFSLSLVDAEKVILRAVEALQEELTTVNRNVENVSSDEAALDSKIQRRTREYEQQQKRLAQLQSFRPQSMGEYEKLEANLKQLYAAYVLRFRNVAYLQQVQDQFDHEEQQRNADTEQRIREKVEFMRTPELLLHEAQY